MARVKDVLDDEGRKIRPLSLLLLLGCLGLGGMIVSNAVFKQTPKARITANTTTHMDVAAPSNTVVLKYDPLIEEVQRELLSAGLYRGLVDGVNGERTKDAITQYQKANGMSVTGEASTDLINSIKFTRQVEAASQFTGSVAPTEQQAVKAPAGPDPKLSIKKVQVALAGLGYDISKIDGRLSEETKGAILKYQMDNGLDMSGLADKTLLTALNIPAN